MMASSRKRRTMRWVLRAGAASAALACALVVCAPAQAAPDGALPQPLLPQEAWVLGQLQAGRAANLLDFSADERRRTIRPAFLEELLAGTQITLPRQGVQIAHAVFEDPVVIEDIDVPVLVALPNNRFKGGLDASRATFARAVSFEDSVFDQGAQFDVAQMNGYVLFTRAVFSGPLNMRYATVAQSVVLNDATLSSFFPVDLNTLTVGRNLFISSTHILGPVNFIGLTTGGDVDARGLELLNPGPALLERMYVGGNADFSGARLLGPTSFADSKVKGDMRLDYAFFLSTPGLVNLNSVDVERNLSMFSAWVSPTITMASARIGDRFNASGSQFRSATGEANFNGLTVGSQATFSGTFFYGPINFVKADIGAGLLIRSALMNNISATVTFNGMRTGDALFIHSSRINSNLDLTYTRIGGNLEVFNNAFGGPVDLRNAIVERKLWLAGSVFEGSVIATDARMQEFLLHPTAAATPTISLLDLSRADVQSQLRIEHATLGQLNAEFLKVGGPALISGGAITGLLNLESASFSNIDLVDVSLPAGSRRGWLDTSMHRLRMITGALPPRTEPDVNLSGMTYDGIGMGDDPGAWRRLIALADSADYNAQVYRSLETFFRDEGYADRADEAYIAQKRRERYEAYGRDVAAFTFNEFLEIFVLYGRRPVLALAWSMGFVLFGAVLFRRRDLMRPLREGATYYSPFWYSLGLFLPFVDLKMNSDWEPLPERRFARNYARVHILLGWIIIPIGLAAVTGLIG